MKQMRKALAMLLSLVMLLALCACGGNTGGAPTETEAPAETAGPAESTPEPAEITPEQSMYPISEEPIEMSLWMAFGNPVAGSTLSTIHDFDAVAAVAEITNVDMTYQEVAGNEMVPAFNVLAAGGDYPDIMVGVADCYTGGAVKALEDGVLLDMTGYMETCAPDYLNNLAQYDLTKAAITDDGSFAVFYGTYDIVITLLGYVVRQDWLDALNLETPVTYDDYYDTLVAFKTEYGCDNAFMLSDTCQDMLRGPQGYGTPGYKNHASGATSHLYQVDGAVKSSFLEEGYRKYLAQLNKWYEAGLFTSDFLSLTNKVHDAARTELVADGRAGIWFSNTSVMLAQAEATGGGIAISPLSDPVETEGDICHFDASSHLNTMSNVGISATCANPEAAIKWCNYWFTDEGKTLYNYGVEGEAYVVENGEISFTDLIYNDASGLDPATARKLFGLIGFFASDTFKSFETDFYTDEQLAAAELWSQNDNAWLMPNVSLSADETNAFSSINTDLCTYTSECVPKFILGEMSVEDDWDAFVNTCKEIGIDEVVGIYQSALDRYYGRTVS